MELGNCSLSFTCFFYFDSDFPIPTWYNISPNKEQYFKYLPLNCLLLKTQISYTSKSIVIREVSEFNNYGATISPDNVSAGSLKVKLKRNFFLTNGLTRSTKFFIYYLGVGAMCINLWL